MASLLQPADSTEASPSTLPSVASLRRRFPEAFVARPAFYWADLALSAGLGWGAFVVAGFWGLGSFVGLAAFVVAVLALYRGVLFIHELTHLSKGAVPRFDTVWHAVVGLPMGANSLLYVGSHLDHHRRAVYGTAADPEYDAIAHWRPLRILGSLLLMPLVPAAFVLRWGVLGPLSYLIPSMRGFVVGRLSTLVINPDYVRPLPEGKEAERWRRQEFGAAAYVWAAAIAVLAGWLPIYWVGLWYALGSCVLMLNQLRTLGAHRYRHSGEPLDLEQQLADSVNLVGPSVLTALAAPVGLRYHTLHHYLPSVPYHALGKLHRAIARELAPESPYRASEAPNVLTAVRTLLRDAAARQPSS